MAVSINSLRIRVPYGAGTGKIRVGRGQVEASVPIRVRTSVSGFIEQAQQQPNGTVVRVAIPGARIRIIGQPSSEQTANADGSFVMSAIQPVSRAEFEILPPASGSLNFPNSAACASRSRQPTITWR
jgi:hypothetical protein